MSKSLADLRSRRWFADAGMRGFAHRQRLQQMGMRRQDVMDRPIIGIINTWSDLSPCHAHLRERAESVKRGVLLAGGLPLELPAMGLGEVLVKPTTMLYRNFLAMEVEELLRSHPIDGVVLLAGCDKTTPGTLMGAISMGIPTLFCPAGPMLNDRQVQAGITRQIGAGTHTRLFWDDYQAGKLTDAEWVALESKMTRSPGTCNTMGTASTMTAIVEALGLALPGSSSIPAMDAGHPRMATDCGERIVGMVWDDLTPRRLLSRASFLNAAVVQMALGGSTNAAVHLIAMARRAGVALVLDDLDAVVRRVPVLANVFPSGDRLMEDFYYAGGLRAVLMNLGGLLKTNAKTVNGKTLGENIADAKVFDDDIIRSVDRALVKSDSLAVLRGNLAPDGAVIKPPAAEAQLHQHTGKAVVFADYNDMAARIDDDDLPVDKDSVIVLKHAGPLGGPGMPEWGQLPIPQKLLKQGVRDMVRISDARMSGTSYGACVLHIAPESWIGGPLALVQDGDLIELDVPGRKLNLKVSDAELAKRKAAWKAPAPHYTRGYGAAFSQHISQANEGCDFDFLEAGAETPDPEIH